MERFIKITIMALKIKKSITFTLLFLVWTSITCPAQVSKSYMYIHSINAQTGEMTSVGTLPHVTYYTFYDDYVVSGLGRKYVRVGYNQDGSISYSSPPNVNISMADVVEIVVSSDYGQVIEVMNSTFMGMTLSIYSYYKYVGEGKDAAFQNAETNRSINSQNDRRRSHESGTCSSCDGTGVNPIPNSGGSRTSWVAHYNSSGSKCPYCGKYSQHYHDRCARCNVPRY